MLEGCRLWSSSVFQISQQTGILRTGALMTSWNQCSQCPNPEGTRYSLHNGYNERQPDTEVILISLGKIVAPMELIRMCLVYFVSADSVLNNQSKESNWLQWDLDQVLKGWIRKFLLLKLHNESFLLNSLVILYTIPASLTKNVLGTWLKQSENNKQHLHSWHWKMLFIKVKITQKRTVLPYLLFRFMFSEIHK